MSTTPQYTLTLENGALVLEGPEAARELNRAFGSYLRLTPDAPSVKQEQKNKASLKIPKPKPTPELKPKPIPQDMALTFTNGLDSLFSGLGDLICSIAPDEPQPKAKAALKNNMLRMMAGMAPRPEPKPELKPAPRTRPLPKPSPY